MSSVNYPLALSLLLEEAAFFASLAPETREQTAWLDNFARRVREVESAGTSLSLAERLVGVARDETERDAIQGWLETGVVGKLESLRGRFPDTLRDLFLIPAISREMARALWARGVVSGEEFERRCLSGELDTWEEFPEGFARRALESLRQARAGTRLFFLPEADATAEQAMAALRSGGVAKRIEPAGACRRRCELVPGVELVIEDGDPESAARQFAALGWTPLPSAAGARDVTVARVPGGLPVRAHHIRGESFGARLALATGNAGHVLTLRESLARQGLRLTWQGIFDQRGRLVPSPDEASLYRLAEMPWVPPELREGTMSPEWDPAVPLISAESLCGIAHCHTNWTDGEGSLETMAAMARQLGCAWLAVTDHSAASEMANGMSPERLREQWETIDRLNAGVTDFRIIKGVEADILEDGSVDLAGEGLEAAELVIGSVHEGEPRSAAENTDRVLRAMASGWIDALGHPACRLLKGWPGRSLEWDRVFEAAAALDVAIEINANPRRLDLDWRLVPHAARHGVRFLIGPDAHRPLGLYNMRYGVDMARKGGLRPEQVLNCLRAAELLEWVHHRRARHGRKK